MGVCPKCKSNVAENDVKCSKCGELLLGITEESGTLNVGQHFQLTDDVAPAPNSVDNSKIAEGDELGDASGTLGAKDLSEAVPELSGGSGTLVGEDVHVSDSSKTIRLPASSDDTGDGEEPSSTQNFSETDLRVAMGIGDSGTDGQLKRIWDAAIGSSGKDSKQSLRFERAEASDSVFRRVAVRQIADANATTEGADYQIQNKLGEGGMGMVYSALQTAVNRVVAIKTIKAEKFEDAASRKQFFYEAEVTADLDHPNIPAIYELGRTEDGTLFYSMKLIRGIEWQKLLRKKTREENLEIFGKMADAVAFAHSKNVIHRDLKPDNVMLGAFGEVYLSDWGLAVNQSKKKDVEFGGTPEFMAPEMARNQRDKIGKHSDIYLLGAILYQVVTGTPPHMGRTQRDRLKAATKNEITPTDKEDPLLKIALRAMETDPSLRHASVAEFQEEIREVNTHAESIANANRASELADSAAKLQDYDKFSQAVFGFRAALDMWANNSMAKVGLQKARFAYGQCAFDKGDYDLALQTLDQTVPEEAEVYEKATKAKLAVEQSKQRFRTLSRVFVAAVSTLLLVATGFAVTAYRAAKQEELAKENAVNEKKLADQAKEIAVMEKKLADEAKELAVTAEGKAVMEKKLADEAKELAVAAEEKAVKEKKLADEAKELAVAAEGKALMEKKLADEAKELAVAAEKRAILAAKEEKERSIQNRIGSSIAEMGRANSSIVQRDNQSASLLLKKTKDISGPEFTQISDDIEIKNVNVPKFETFAWKRVNLLTNSDLSNLTTENDSVSAMDFAPAVNVGVIGTQKGQVLLYRYEANVLKSEVLKAGALGNTIDCVAISPKGDEVIFTATDRGESGTYVCSLSGAQKPNKVEALGKNKFESMRYSPDEKYIVIGISGGVRVLNRNEADWMTKSIDSKNKILEVRGDLLDLQWLDANTVVATTAIENKVTLFELSLNKVGQNGTDGSPSTKITLPASIVDNLSRAAILSSSKKVLLAGTDGELRIGDLKTDLIKDKRVLSVENIVRLPKVHQAAVSKLVVNSSGRILSVSDKEPVVHVWKSNAGGEVTYDSFLTGAPSKNITSTPNIKNALFASDDTVFGVDNNGTTIVWSIERQKQRRKLEPEVKYESPVVGNYARGTTPQAISVTDDGVVDLWNLQTGKSEKTTGTDKTTGRFTYFGHTPGAVFVDSAVDLKRGIIVTSASLDKAERSYLQNKKHNWEFCVWDQATGNMIKRWSIEAPVDPDRVTEKTGKENARTNEPRMTMLNDGQEILIANFVETLVYTVFGEKKDLGLPQGSKKFDAYFAVPNPKNPSLIAMVNQTGVTWLWDRNDSNSWWTPDANSLYTKSRADEGIAIKGTWTEDGNRFFLVFSSGFVKMYDKSNFRTPAITSLNDDSVNAKSTFTIRKHHDLDLATVPIANGGDRLFVNVRLPEKANPTSEKSIAFTLDAKANRMDESKKETKAGLRWLDATTAGTPKLSDRVHPGFRLNRIATDPFLASQKQGSHTFVSTVAGAIYDIIDELNAPAKVGPQKMISATSDKEGSVVMQLREDGSILRLDLSAEGESTWNKVAFKAEGFKTIQLSPNKAQLAMMNPVTHTLRIVDAVSGGLVGEYADVAAATWDPEAAGELAMIHTKGEVKLIGSNGTTKLRSIDVKNGRQVKAVHFFNERWADDTATRHLLVQMEGEKTDGDEASGRIEFVALKSDEKSPDKGETNGIDVKSGYTIATSPVDSLFVTGDDAGTVTVWFASPTWDKPGKIFDLEGHRGAPIKSIAFGEGGKTLITSDANKGLYGWMSEDSTTARKN